MILSLFITSLSSEFYNGHRYVFTKMITPSTQFVIDLIEIQKIIGGLDVKRPYNA